MGVNVVGVGKDVCVDVCLLKCGWGAPISHAWCVCVCVRVCVFCGCYPHCLITQAIHEKISSLDFSDCRARIKQVDSHPTLGNGIVIQVCVVAQLNVMVS